MPFRIVIPRSVPFVDSNRVQAEVWKRGYSTRLAGRDPHQAGRVLVEFSQMVQELPDPADVAGLVTALEGVLTSRRVAASFSGQGAWLETIDRSAPGRRPARARS